MQTYLRSFLEDTEWAVTVNSRCHPPDLNVNRHCQPPDLNVNSKCQPTDLNVNGPCQMPDLNVRVHVRRQTLMRTVNVSLQI